MVQFLSALAMVISSIVFLFFALFVCLEVFLRKTIRKVNKTAPPVNNILFYSAGVQKQPNSTLHFRFYTAGATIFASADCRLNNMGYFSENDYRYEKEEGEFRILVLGGEQTASSVASQSWPDFLQKILNEKKCFAKKVSVINLAWPDAGPEHYLRTWETEGYKFNPDLVIINIVESDYTRYLTGAKLAYLGCPLEKMVQKKLVYDHYNGEPVFTVGHSLVENAKDLSDRRVIASRTFGFFAPLEYMTDLERIKNLQQRLARDFVKGGMPKFGQLTMKILRTPKRRLMAEIKGIFVHSKLNWNLFLRNIVQTKYPEYDGMPVRHYTVVDTPKDCEIYGDRIFKAMLEKIPNAIFIHSFHSVELAHKTEFGYTNQMMKNNPQIKVIDMRERLPKDVDVPSFVKECYLNPFMGEKWSVKGHQTYANLVADLILEQPLISKYLTREKMTSV